MNGSQQANPYTNLISSTNNQPNNNNNNGSIPVPITTTVGNGNGIGTGGGVASSNNTAQGSNVSVSLPSSTIYQHPNLTRYLTGGLLSLYTSIRTKRRTQAGLSSSQQQHGHGGERITGDPRDLLAASRDSHTKPDGFLDITRLPLLNNRYRMISLLGEGTFSQLLRCEDTFAIGRPHVAIKVMNAKYAFIGSQEWKMIVALRSSDPKGDSGIIRPHHTFTFQRHLCLVLDLLHLSLLDVLRVLPGGSGLPSDRAAAAGLSGVVSTHSGEAGEGRMPLNDVRRIAFQVLISLCFLKKHAIIHADIKPENILFATPPSTISSRSRSSSSASSSIRPPSSLMNSQYPLPPAPPRIRLIDFGNAMTVNETARYYQDFDVQTLYYRAPEVLLGIPFSYPIDIWSLGCVMVELTTGKPLFPAQSNRELFDHMFRMLGPFPSEPFTNGKFTSRYLTSTNSYPANTSSIESLRKLERERLGAVNTILKSSDRDFVTFVAALLEYNPDKRLTPTQALFHPFLAPICPFALLFGSPSSSGRISNSSSSSSSLSSSSSSRHRTTAVTSSSSSSSNNNSSLNRSSNSLPTSSTSSSTSFALPLPATTSSSNTTSAATSTISLPSSSSSSSVSSVNGHHNSNNNTNNIANPNANANNHPLIPSIPSVPSSSHGLVLPISHAQTVPLLSSSSIGSHSSHTPSSSLSSLSSSLAPSLSSLSSSSSLSSTPTATSAAAVAWGNDAYTNAALAACRAAASMATIPSLSTSQMLSQLDAFGLMAANAQMAAAQQVAHAHGVMNAPPLSPSLPFGARVPPSLVQSSTHGHGHGQMSRSIANGMMATNGASLPSTLMDDMTASAAWAIAAGLPLGADGFALRPAAPPPFPLSSFPSLALSSPSHAAAAAAMHATNGYGNHWPMTTTANNGATQGSGSGHIAGTGTNGNVATGTVSAAAAAAHPSMTAFIPFPSPPMYPSLSPQHYMNLSNMAAAAAATTSNGGITSTSGNSSTNGHGHTTSGVPHIQTPSLLSLHSSYMHTPLAPVSPPIRIGGNGIYPSLFPAASAQQQAAAAAAAAAVVSQALAAAGAPLSPSVNGHTHAAHLFGTAATSMAHSTNGGPLSPIMPHTPPIVSPMRQQRSLAFGGNNTTSGNGTGVSLHHLHATHNALVSSSSGGGGGGNTISTPSSPSLTSISPSMNIRSLYMGSNGGNAVTTAPPFTLAATSVVAGVNGGINAHGGMADNISPTSNTSRKRRSMGGDSNDNNSNSSSSSSSSSIIPASLKRIRSNTSNTSMSPPVDAVSPEPELTAASPTSNNNNGRHTPLLPLSLSSLSPSAATASSSTTQNGNGNGNGRSISRSPDHHTSGSQLRRLAHAQASIMTLPTGAPNHSHHHNHNPSHPNGVILSPPLPSQPISTNVPPIVPSPSPSSSSSLSSLSCHPPSTTNSNNNNGASVTPSAMVATATTTPTAPVSSLSMLGRRT